MNKSELVSAIVDNADVEVTKKQTEAIVNAYHSTIVSELQKGNKVQLVGFGTYETKKRAARKGHNPKTGAEIDIPAATTPCFKPGSAFKDAVK